ncbi:hypothetical protein TFLX_01363 [Thermoflexales bacterium]|nr:hypothetical protein TFLX_01363 [Thermoflexales bacterium]
MGDTFFLLLILLTVLAIFLREDTILTLVYFLVGTYALSHWWSRRALKTVEYNRSFQRRAFLYEKVPVQLELVNRHWLPVPWLQLTEKLPLELIVPSTYRSVTTIGPYGRRQFDYTLHADRRGYYTIGPLHLRSGDLIGLNEEINTEGAADHLIVYPKIIPFANVKLPSRSPIGTLRHTQPLFEDPSRVRGKRDYVAGDSLRRVDWKATATLGRLQVKQFEPSIALETAIFLNLNADEYEQRTRLDATELAIVVAASLANWIIGKRQSAGLSVNGADPIGAGEKPQALPPRKGRAHLTRILDVLARIRSISTPPFAQMLQHAVPHLPWGTTVILITGAVDDIVFDEIFRARRAGLNVVLILCGAVKNSVEIQQRAKHFGIPVQHFMRERDLDLWRG